MKKISTILFLLSMTSILCGQEFEISVAPTINNVFNYSYPGVFKTKAKVGLSTTLEYSIRSDKRLSLGIGLNYQYCQVEMIPGKYSSLGMPFTEKINLFSIYIRSAYNMQRGFYISLDPTYHFQDYDILTQIIDNQTGLGLSFGVGKKFRFKERLFSNFNPDFLKIEPRLWINNIIPLRKKDQHDRLTIFGLNMGLVFRVKND